jgi:membrane associated rhomboid family serine protease/Zn-finger nucleic acid-binding protein
MHTYTCPHCQEELERTAPGRGVYWYCPVCQGRLAGMGLVRRLIDRVAVNAVWRAASDSPHPGPHVCPACMKPMPLVAPDAGLPPLDVCGRCHLIWFDGGEWEAMPASPVPPGPPELSPKAKAMLALRKVESIRATAEVNDRDRSGLGASVWRVVPYIFDIPVNRPYLPLPGIPMVLVLLSLAAFILAGSDWPDLLPPWTGGRVRVFPLVLVLSLLLHGGIVHLAASLYAFVLGARLVEARLGSGRLLVIAGGSGLLGVLLATLHGGGSGVPVIGMSGVATGLLVFEGLCRPWERMDLALGSTGGPHGWAVPAWVVVAAWLLGIGAAGQFGVAGMSPLPVMVHLGGALVALAAWARWREE